MDKHKLFCTPHTQLPLTQDVELTKCLADPPADPAAAQVLTK